MRATIGCWAISFRGFGSAGDGSSGALGGARYTSAFIAGAGVTVTLTWSLIVNPTEGMVEKISDKGEKQTQIIHPSASLFWH
jgi:hypothetical protein